jgi:hypothetical protein
MTVFWCELVDGGCGRRGRGELNVVYTDSGSPCVWTDTPNYSFFSPFLFFFYSILLYLALILFLLPFRDLFSLFSLRSIFHFLSRIKLTKLINVTWLFVSAGNIIGNFTFTLYIIIFSFDHLRSLVVRDPDYRSRDSGFDSRRYQIFWEVVGLERGPLSLVRITEELIERKSSGSVSRKPILTAISLTMRHTVSAKVGINFADMRR